MGRIIATYSLPSFVGMDIEEVKENMIWQDIVIMAAVFGFSASSLPTIWAHYKPPMLTCVLFVICALVLTVSFATLGMWLTTSAQGLFGLMWLIILIQKAEWIWLPKKAGEIWVIILKFMKQIARVYLCSK